MTYHYPGTTVFRKFYLAWSRLVEALLVGPCPRCNTEGECKMETGHKPGWPDFGFSEGDLCSDRPLKNEEIARALLADKYRSTGAEIRSFWRDGKVYWLTRHGVHNTYPFSHCHPSEPNVPMESVVMEILSCGTVEVHKLPNEEWANWANGYKRGRHRPNDGLLPKTRTGRKTRMLYLHVECDLEF